MTKTKLYNPDKCNSFQMMFGFEQPYRYIRKNKKPLRNENNNNKLRRSKKPV